MVTRSPALKLVEAPLAVHGLTAFVIVQDAIVDPAFLAKAIVYDLPALGVVSANTCKVESDVETGTTTLKVPPAFWTGLFPLTHSM